MGYWSNVINALTGRNIRLTDTIATNAQFFEFNGKIEWEACDNPLELKRVFETCTPLSSIINSKAKALASGNLQVLNATTDNYVRGKHKDWEKLLNNPNPLQSKRQFFRQLYTYLNIEGWCIAMKVYPTGFSDIPSKLWVLPYWCLQVDTRTFTGWDITKEHLLENIYFNYNGFRTKLDPKDIILFTDDTGSIDQRTLLPISKITLCQYPITTILSEEEAEVTMIQRRGAIGILSNEGKDVVGHVQLADGQKEDLQREFRKYGMSREQSQVIITSANLKWQAMAYSTKELMLIESYKKAYMALCDEFGYPFELTAQSERKTLANVDSFDTILYQNYIMPEADAICEQLMAGLNAEINNIKIRLDYTHVPALQSSEKEKGEGLKAMNDALQILWDNNAITLNMWLEKIGEEKITDGRGEKYKYQLTPEELGVITQDNTNNNQNNGN